jgi:hypothetical protein
MAKVHTFAQMRKHFRMIDAEHPLWEKNFDETVRTAQMEEDLFAAKSVCGVLITIVTGGVLLGVLAVLLATLL